MIFRFINCAEGAFKAFHSGGGVTAGDGEGKKRIISIKLRYLYRTIGLTPTFPKIGEGGPSRKRWGMRLTHTARHKLSTSSASFLGTFPDLGEGWALPPPRCVRVRFACAVRLRDVEDADPYGIWLRSDFTCSFRPEISIHNSPRRI